MPKRATQKLRGELECLLYFCLLSPPRRSALLKLPRLNQADATFFDACFSCFRVNHQIDDCAGKDAQWQLVHDAFMDTLCDVAAEKSMPSELVLWFKQHVQGGHMRRRRVEVLDLANYFCVSDSSPLSNISWRFGFCLGSRASIGVESATVRSAKLGELIPSKRRE